MKSTDSERTSLGLTLAKSLYFSVPHLQKDYYKRDDWHTESRPNTHHPLLLSFIRQALTSHPLSGFCDPGLLGHILLFFHPSPCSHSLSQAPFLPSRPFMNNVGPARQRPSGSGDHICSHGQACPWLLVFPNWALTPHPGLNLQLLMSWQPRVSFWLWEPVPGRQ